MTPEQAVFIRIDTADCKPYLQGPSCAELVVSTLFAGREKGWFDLIGFVVLPNEVQLLIYPRRLVVSTLVNSLETDLYPMMSVLTPISGSIFDTDFYREKVDCDEECRQRLRWMHLAPVRARLATLAETYPFSSANPRYRDLLRSIQSV
jgi:hypothetical protein